jgi:hypothetical protein
MRNANTQAAVWAFVLGIPAAASAQGDAAAGAGISDRWSVEITPYLWAAGLDGNTAADGVGSEIDTDYSFFSLDNLDFALGTSLDARKGRWGMLYDAMYVEFSDAFERSPGSEVEVSGGVFDAIGSMTASNGRPLELLFGVRYVALKATVDVAPIPRATARESWLDPLVGLTFAHAFNERWSVTLRGDVGAIVGARDECLGDVRLANQRQNKAARRLSHAADGFRRRRSGARRDVAGLRRRSELAALTSSVSRARIATHSRRRSRTDRPACRSRGAPTRRGE